MLAQTTELLTYLIANKLVNTSQQHYNVTRTNCIKPFGHHSQQKLETRTITSIRSASGTLHRERGMYT